MSDGVKLRVAGAFNAEYGGALIAVGSSDGAATVRSSTAGAAASNGLDPRAGGGEAGPATFASAEPWSYVYDEAAQRFRDVRTGTFISANELRTLRDAFVETRRGAITDLAQQLADGSLGVDEWQAAMRAEIKMTLGVEYAFGRGGMLAMGAGDWQTLDDLVSQQWAYLDGFAEALANGELSTAQLLNRAGMYVDAGIGAYERGQAAAFDVEDQLPVYPGDDCDGMTSCRCAWDIQVQDDGSVDCYWIAVGDNNTCDACDQHASDYNPLTIEADAIDEAAFGAGPVVVDTEGAAVAAILARLERVGRATRLAEDRLAGFQDGGDGHWVTIDGNHVLIGVPTISEGDWHAAGASSMSPRDFGLTNDQDRQRSVAGFITPTGQLYVLDDPHNSHVIVGEKIMQAHSVSKAPDRTTKETFLEHYGLTRARLYGSQLGLETIGPVTDHQIQTVSAMHAARSEITDEPVSIYWDLPSASDPASRFLQSHTVSGTTMGQVRRGLKDLAAEPNPPVRGMPAAVAMALDWFVDDDQRVRFADEGDGHWVTIDDNHVLIDGPRPSAGSESGPTSARSASKGDPEMLRGLQAASALDTYGQAKALEAASGRLTVSLNGLDPKETLPAVKTLGQLSQDYPVPTVTEIQPFGAEDGHGWIRTAYAQYQRTAQGGTIGLNPDNWGTTRQLGYFAPSETNVNESWFAPQMMRDGPGYLAAHEYGHGVWSNILERDGRALAHWDDGVPSAPKDSGLGLYSKTNGGERFAEAFASYYYGGAGPAATAMGKLLQAQYGTAPRYQAAHSAFANDGGAAHWITLDDGRHVLIGADEHTGGLRDVSAAQFKHAVSRAAESHKAGQAVADTLSEYGLADYQHMHLVLSEDGKTGYALKPRPDGGRELVSVFNVDGKGKGGLAVEDAVLHGATDLDAFDQGGFLPQLYGKYGFKEVGRAAWDPAMAGAESMPDGSKPDVVFMHREPVAKNGTAAHSQFDEVVPEGGPEVREVAQEQTPRVFPSHYGYRRKRTPAELDAEHQAVHEQLRREGQPVDEESHEQAQHATVVGRVRRGLTDLLALMAYNPDEPRDERGRWTGDGSGGHQQTAANEIGVNPNGPAPWDMKAPAPSRYGGDNSIYSPALQDQTGAYVLGRRIQGTALHDDTPGGVGPGAVAMHVFIPEGSARDYARYEGEIAAHSDHAQLHPGEIAQNVNGELVWTRGNNYYVRGDYRDLGALSHQLGGELVERYGADKTEVKFMTDRTPGGTVLPVGVPVSHMRVVVPFAAGTPPNTVGEPAVGVATRNRIVGLMSGSEGRIVTMHLDFNGVHLATDSTDRTVKALTPQVVALGALEETASHGPGGEHPAPAGRPFEHNAGATRFIPTSLNVENYPVRDVKPEIVARRG